VRVHWTTTAINHLRHIHTYIGQSSPAYASRIVDRLTRRSQQIAQFPESGRIVPETDLPQIREVMEGPYRIMYHITPDQVDIIAVIHGSQQTPWTP
jgi:plasmid stabilization system protein ParE